MQTWIRRLRWIASGTVTFGVLQALGDVNFNQIWFSFLTSFLNLIVTILFGGSAGALSGTGGLFT